MDIGSRKYHVPSEESEILPNLLGLTTKEEIESAESQGVYDASLDLLGELTNETIFDLKYIYHIHQRAFGHLYNFAGKLREVNISKGGFVFPAAIYLPQTMADFQENMLKPLPDTLSDTDEALRYIATIHAELLFIHPFREGNGRVARILANMMAAKYGLPLFPFRKITLRVQEEYISGVQQAASGNYDQMLTIFRMLYESV